MAVQLDVRGHANICSHIERVLWAGRAFCDSTQGEWWRRRSRAASLRRVVGPGGRSAGERRCAWAGGALGDTPRPARTQLTPAPTHPHRPFSEMQFIPPPHAEIHHPTTTLPPHPPPSNSPTPPMPARRLTPPPHSPCAPPTHRKVAATRPRAASSDQPRARAHRQPSDRTQPPRQRRWKNCQGGSCAPPGTRDCAAAHRAPASPRNSPAQRGRPPRQQQHRDQ